MFKLIYGKEAQIFLNIQKIETLFQLQQMVETQFSDCPQSFNFTYQDQEGDQISVDSNLDFQIFKEQAVKAQETNYVANLNLAQTDQIQLLQASALIEITENQSQYSSQSEIRLGQVQERLIYVFQDPSQKFQVEPNQNRATISFSQEYNQDQHSSQEKFFGTKAKYGWQQDEVNQSTEFQDCYYQSLLQCVLLDRNKSQTQKIDTLQPQILKKVLACQQIEEISTEKNGQQQINQLIKRSLRSQLPIFIKQFTRRTIANVKQVLGHMNQAPLVAQQIDQAIMLLV